MFSGGIEIEYWLDMGQTQDDCPDVVAIILCAEKKE